MADIIDKAKKKERLRSRVLKFDESDFKTPKRTFLIPHKKEKKILIGIIFLVILTIFLAFLAIRKYSHHITLYIRTFTTAKSIFSTDCRYTKFSSGIVRYSRDGISYIKDNGDMAWVDSYDMDHALIAKSKNYVAVASKGGKDVYIYDLRGFVSSFESEKLIDKLAISDDGVISLFTHTDDARYIDIYEKSGRNGDIYIKYTRDEDGEVADIAFSPDGNMLMVSTYTIEENDIRSKIIFYNINKDFDGVNADRFYRGNPRLERVVASFNGKNEEMYNKIYFLSNEDAAAIYNGGIVFYNIDKKTSLVTVRDIVEEERPIHSISVEDSYVSILVKDDVDNTMHAMLFDNKGHKIYDKLISFDYLTYYTEDGHTYFMGIDDLMILDKKGFEKYRGKLYDDMIYIKKKFGIFFYDVVVGCKSGVKRAILY